MDTGICIVEGCERKLLARGLCNAHYKRLNTRTPMDAPVRYRRPAAQSVESAFAERVTPGPNGCLDWIGHTYTNGYGRISVGGRWQSAHRVSYELHHGEIPKGLIVRHSCDRPICVAPEHLLVGTFADNTRDCIERGRHFTPFPMIRPSS